MSMIVKKRVNVKSIYQADENKENQANYCQKFMFFPKRIIADKTLMIIVPAIDHENENKLDVNKPK